MITGSMLRDSLISAANNISNYKNAVNALNVFPVPDGDTGSNMSMTMAAAKKVLETIPDDAPIDSVADKAAAAMLRGARGNSGVILSLIFRGIAEGLAGCDTANSATLAIALDLGSARAYKAVSNPTEGTILTVIKSAANAAREQVNSETNAAETFEVAYQAATEALAKTPELLHTLKRAKVVDAGGQGLCYIFAGMLRVFCGGSIISCEENTEEETPMTGLNFFSEDEILYTYCSEFIVRKSENCPLTADDLRSFLLTIGDCVVVVEDDDIIKVHTHSNAPGAILTKGLEYGELLTVKIENMKQQHRNAFWGANTNEASKENPTIAEPKKKYGFVSVAAGEGFESLFSELGVDAIVSGGQTMNPSTQDILNAIQRVPAEIVFVLPNNKNILMAANQCISLVSDKTVAVLETKSVPQGISAVLSFDPNMEKEENIKNMTKAFSAVHTVSVTTAARDSSVFGLNIKKGQYLGLEDGKITVAENDPNDAASRALRKLAKRSGILTIYYGDSITEQKAESLASSLREKFTGAEIVTVNGGQPVYTYLISIE